MSKMNLFIKPKPVMGKRSKTGKPVYNWDREQAIRRGISLAIAIVVVGALCLGILGVL